MDRELVLVVLAVLLIGVSFPLGAVLALAVPGVNDTTAPGRALERAAARRLLLPVVPTALALFTLLGWAFVEPDDSERVPWLALVATVPVFVVWGRAVIRALRALAPRQVRTAAAMGLFHPRIVLADEFASAVDEEALRAALAHERAHVLRRDPLRIWLAQIVTDLQWPLPGNHKRFKDWLIALEFARDEEARKQVDGADLAAAVIAAARMEQPTPFAVAGITSASAVLEVRVHRLLAPIPAPSRDRSVRLLGIAVVVGIAAAFVVGAGFGEQLMRQVLGWAR